jgi:hypothetical protein
MAKPFYCRCGLCKVDFATRQQMAQHFDGPEHAAAISDPCRMATAFFKSQGPLMDLLQQAKSRARRASAARRRAPPKGRARDAR